MDKEKQRIAIAKACGYTSGRCPCGDELCSAWQNPAKDNWEDIPDYLNDLDAMYEAEKVLTDYQKHHYLTHLRRIAVTPSFEASRFVAFATAAQRAEAFLKTLNLWEDGK